MRPNHTVDPRDTFMKFLNMVHRRRNRQKSIGKGRRFYLGDVQYLHAALAIEQQGGFEERVFWKKIHFGRVVVWCGVNQMIINFSEASILRSSLQPVLLMHPDAYL